MTPFKGIFMIIFVFQTMCVYFDIFVDKQRYHDGSMSFRKLHQYIISLLEENPWDIEMITYNNGKYNANCQRYLKYLQQYSSESHDVISFKDARYNKVEYYFTTKNMDTSLEAVLSNTLLNDKITSFDLNNQLCCGNVQIYGTLQSKMVLINTWSIEIEVDFVGIIMDPSDEQSKKVLFNMLLINKNMLKFKVLPTKTLFGDELLDIYQRFKMEKFMVKYQSNWICNNEPFLLRLQIMMYGSNIIYRWDNFEFGIEIFDENSDNKYALFYSKRFGCTCIMDLDGKEETIKNSIKLSFIFDPYIWVRYDQKQVSFSYYDRTSLNRKRLCSYDIDPGRTNLSNYRIRIIMMSNKPPQYQNIKVMSFVVGELSQFVYDYDTLLAKQQNNPFKPVPYPVLKDGVTIPAERFRILDTLPQRRNVIPDPTAFITCIFIIIILTVIFYLT